MQAGSGGAAHRWHWWVVRLRVLAGSSCWKWSDRVRPDSEGACRPRTAVFWLAGERLKVHRHRAFGKQLGHASRAAAAAGTLRPVAAVLEQRPRRQHGFDAFGDQAERLNVGQPDDGARSRRSSGSNRGPHEALVDLQRVDGNDFRCINTLPAVPKSSIAIRMPAVFKSVRCSGWRRCLPPQRFR